MTVDNIFKQVNIFLSSKGYKFLNVTKHDEVYSRFYFKYQNNPIELGLIIQHKYDKINNEFGDPDQIFFLSQSSNASLGEFISINDTKTKKIDISDNLELEPIFQEFELNKLHNLAPDLCEYILDNYNSYEMLVANQIDGNMLLSLFGYCDMMDECMQWIASIEAYNLLPQTAQDVFLF